MPKTFRIRHLLLGLTAAALSFVSAAHAEDKAYTDPSQADADFAYQGEYTGAVKSQDGDIQIGLQVIALGDGKFHAVGYHGGLPGAGWDQQEKKEADGELKDGVVVIKSDAAEARIDKDGAVTLALADGTEIGKLNKINRSSPTLGAKPPEGAVVLFDGSSTDALEGGKITADKSLEAGTQSKQKFGSQKVHIEFCLPYMPTARGQGRGNSGIYLQGRYEVQMLDSFGLKGENNECGGIYTVAAPKVNMCLPPLAWQTYDITYTAAKYDGAKLLEKPRMTVEHNGVVIHKDVELPADRNTTAAPVGPGPEKGPLYLQNHGNPVRYRNIWVQEL